MAKESILVVEDNREIATIVADYILRPQGYQVTLAHDGVEGLEKVRAEKPDLMLLDLEMPRLGGLEVLEALQAENLEVPTILMTSHGSEDLAVTVFRKGVRDYIIKPVEAEELVEVVERALGGVRLRREKEALTERLARANSELENRVKELNALYGIGRSVTSLLDLDRLLARVVEAAVYITGAEEGSLFLLDEDTNELYVRSAQGWDERHARELRLKVGDSLAGEVLRTGEPVMIGSAGHHRVKTSYLVNAIMYVPLKAKGRIIGVLMVDNRVSTADFTRNDLFLLSLLSDYAAVAIENARLFQQSEDGRRMLEAILAGTEDMIIVTDEKDRILLINESAQRGFGLPEGPLQGQVVTDLIGNASLRRLYGGRDAEHRINRSEIVLPSGQVLLATLSPIVGVGRIVVMQDITNLKKLDQMKSQFVVTMAHHLRSPLTSIRGLVDLLPTVGELNEKQMDFLAGIRQGVEGVTGLIDDLLDISRIEAGVDLDVEVCDLTEVIGVVLDKARAQADEKQQVLRAEIPDVLLHVRVDRLRLEQALDSLLDNALRCTPRGGKIEVTVSQDNGCVMVSVRDSGPGIPLSEQAHIFDPFHRVRREESEGAGGSALGLAVAKSVIEKYQGRIWVESEPGKGSSFVFLLPKCAEGRDAAG